MTTPSEGCLGKEVETPLPQPEKATHCFIAHTPTPWSICTDPANDSWYAGITISGKTGQGKTDYRVADVFVLNHAYKANAEFIVRACNAHDDLLAALKAALETVELPTGIGLGVGGLEFRFPAWVEQARAAISKAESQS